MMQKNFFSGVALLVLASLLVSTSAHEQQRRNLFQRRLDIDDVSPLSARDNKRILQMMDRGILHSSELSAREKPMQQRALKGSSSKSKKSEMSTNSGSNTRPPKLVYYGGFNDTDTGSSSIKKGKGGKGGKGGKARRSRKKKCEPYTSSSSSSSSSTSRSTKAPSASRKSGKGWCTEGETELLPLQLYFAHEQTDNVVVPVEDASEYYMGTTYTYNERAFLGEVSDPALNNLTELFYEGRQDYSGYEVEGDDVIGRAAGRCTRIDPNIGTDGVEDPDNDFTFSTYCQFTYEFFEGDDGATATYMTAEGVIPYFGTNCTDDCLDLVADSNTGICGQLAVTGGTGFFRRVVGEVYVCPTATSTDYMEVFATLWLDSRVVSYSVYDDIIEGPSGKSSRSSGKGSSSSGKASSSDMTYTT